MTFVITDACIDEKNASCTAECPVDCIYEGGRMYYINPVECINCGACVPACPVNAIYFDEDLPAQLSHYADINAEFFGASVTGWGRPGGSWYVGASPKDHETVADYPRTER